ncbi:MAG: C39 family peptidase [Planctomycetota bacterium]
MNTRKKISIVLLCFALPAAVFLWYQRLSLGYSIPHSGGESLSVSFAETPIYLQTDPLWADKHIGGSNEKVQNVGCTICCVSMGFAEFGIELKPDRLNMLLKKKHGYTDSGWVIWAAIPTVTDNKVNAEVISKVSYDVIDQAIQRGHPVIAKVYINDAIAHWVLIVGKDGIDYLIKDPLGDGKTLEKLSKYDSNIYAIRILKPI